jgi:DNA-binding NtrC family response regulator
VDLLRVLEDRTFVRVGGNEALPTDARIVAATNRDLARAVADGSFRQDLFYRLNVIPVRLPPLRERPEDIPLLVEHLLERLSMELGRSLPRVSPEAMALLLAHPWPGNVRELRNVLERAAVVTDSDTLEPVHLGLSSPGPGTAGAPPASASALVTLEEVERRHIALTLERVAGNVTRAARSLGIDRATLYNKIRRYGLRRPEAQDEDIPA